jgi:hypothetical protein
VGRTLSAAFRHWPWLSGTLRTLARRQGRTDDPVTAEEAGQDLARGAPGASMSTRPPAWCSPPGLLRHRGRHRPVWLIVLHDAWRQGLGHRRSARPIAQSACGHGAGSNKLPTTSSVCCAISTRSGSRLEPTRDGRTPATRCAAAMAGSRRHRSRFSRRRRMPLRPPTVPPTIYEAFGVPGANAVRACGGSTLAERIQRELLGRARSGERIWRWPSMVTVDLSTASAAIWGTCSAAARWTRVRRGWSSTGCSLRICWGSSGSGRSRAPIAAYNPIGYHTGSVWTHDTAIALFGMAREGLSRRPRAR